MSCFAVYGQRLGPEELAAVVGSIGWIPSPGNVVAGSRGWILILGL